MPIGLTAITHADERTMTMKDDHPPAAPAERASRSGLRPLIWVPALIAIVGALLAIFATE
jgi:hypothetical protein